MQMGSIIILSCSCLISSFYWLLHIADAHESLQQIQMEPLSDRLHQNFESYTIRSGQHYKWILAKKFDSFLIWELPSSTLGIEGTPRLAADVKWCKAMNIRQQLWLNLSSCKNSVYKPSRIRSSTSYENEPRSSKACAHSVISDDLYEPAIRISYKYLRTIQISTHSITGMDEYWHKHNSWNFEKRPTQNPSPPPSLSLFSSTPPFVIPPTSRTSPTSLHSTPDHRIF